MILVLKGVSLKVPEGGIVALLGANGAGKTTTLRAVSNLLHGERGDVTKGSIEYRGERIQGLTRVRHGQARRGAGDGGPPLLCAPDGRGEPADRRVRAPQDAESRADIAADLDKVYTYFPRLKARRSQPVRLHLGRRAADDRDRPRADGATEDDPARRAVDGPGAADRRGDFRASCTT